MARKTSPAYAPNGYYVPRNSENPKHRNWLIRVDAADAKNPVHVLTVETIFSTHRLWEKLKTSSPYMTKTLVLPLPMEGSWEADFYRYDNFNAACEAHADFAVDWKVPGDFKPKKPANPAGKIDKLAPDGYYVGLRHFETDIIFIQQGKCSYNRSNNGGWATLMWSCSPRKTTWQKRYQRFDTLAEAQAEVAKKR